MRKILIAAALLAACGKKSDETPPTNGSGAPIDNYHYVANKDTPLGLDMKLSDGKQGPPAFDHAKLAPAKKISDAEVQQLLARSKPITAEATDTTNFALRPSSQPPPRTGETIKDSFPAKPSSLLPPAKSIDNGKDLKVLRYMPEGAVKLAPELSVTFSQPMVAVTSQEDA